MLTVMAATAVNAMRVMWEMVIPHVMVSITQSVLSGSKKHVFKVC